MTDNHIQLNGKLGQDPMFFEMDEKQFMKLSVATKDTLLNETTGQQTSGVTWHNVLIFMPHVISMANDLKKGDNVHVTGSLAYRSTKSEDGYKIKQAAIIASLVSKRS